MICRDLVNSIKDGSPYTWKMYYTGEFGNYLREKSMKALELVMKGLENWKKEEGRERSWISIPLNLVNLLHRKVDLGFIFLI